MDFKREFSADGEWMDVIFEFPYGVRTDCDKLLKEISDFKKLRKNTPKIAKDNQSKIDKFMKQFQPGIIPGTTQTTSRLIIILGVVVIIFVPLTCCLCFKHYVLSNMVFGWQRRGVENALPIPVDDILPQRGFFHLLPFNRN